MAMCVGSCRIARFFVLSSLVLLPFGRCATAESAIARSAFDAVYNDDALATLRADLATLGYSADTLYTILVAYDGFMAAYPNDAASFDKDALRASQQSMFNGTAVTDPAHRDLLARMANMFWVEIRVGLPWHLQDLSAEGLRDLYSPVINYPIWRGDYDTFFKITTSNFQYQAEYLPPDNNLGIAAPGHFLLLPLALKIVVSSASPAEALAALAFWTENRFFHPYWNGLKGEDWDSSVYDAYPLVYNGFYGPGSVGWHDFFDLFRERIADCHLVAGLMKALASAVNIPVLAGQVDYPPDPHGGHGASFFRDADMFLHGDWVADLMAIPGDLLVLDRATFIQTLADGHAPGRLNDDYLDLETKLRQQSGISLGLSRTAGATTLYVEGSLEVCEADQQPTLAPMTKQGFTFSCVPTPPGQATLTGCTSITCASDENPVAIQPYGELMAGWRALLPTTTTSTTVTTTSTTTTTVAVTTTTLAGGPCAFACGDADGNGRLTATDALAILRASIGLGSCLACVCDTDGSGQTTATDALLALEAAVGMPVALACL